MRSARIDLVYDLPLFSEPTEVWEVVSGCHGCLGGGAAGLVDAVMQCTPFLAIAASCWPVIRTRLNSYRLGQIIIPAFLS